MPNTPRMKWPIPGEHVDPWFEAFVDLMGEVDASGYAAREDRNIIGTGGGTFTFVSATGVITWSSTISFLAANTGFLWQIPAGNVSLADGQVWYVNLVRAPSDNTALANVVASNLSAAADGDAAFVIAVRRGNKVYFRNGNNMADGDSFEVFETTGAGGGGGGSGSTALVFRPGSAFTGPVVFNAWSDLLTKLGTLRVAANNSGRYTVQLDDTDGAVTIPTGPSDFTNVSLIGMGKTVATAATVADGAVFTKLRDIKGVALSFGGATAPILDIATGERIDIEDSFISASGTAPFFDLTALGASPASFRLRKSSFGNAGFQVVSGLLACTLTVDVLEESNVGGNSFFLPNGTVFFRVDERSSFASETQTLSVLNYVFVEYERMPISVQTGNFNAVAGICYEVDTTGGSRVVTLPTAFNVRGSCITIKNIGAGSNTVTINADGSDLIDGAASYVITALRGSVTIISSGGTPVGRWDIISEKKNVIGTPGEKIRRVVAMSLDAETDQPTYQVVGNFALHPDDYTLTGTTREIRFLVVGLVTNLITTGDIQLYNLTDSAVVATHSFTGAPETSPTKKVSAALILPASEKMYEVRIRVTGGTPPTDKVFAMWAGVQIDNIY